MQGYQRYEHFLHRDAAMLECVAIVRHIIIVIIGIGKEIVARSKDVGRTQVGSREQDFTWVFDFKDFFGVVFQILPQFVAQVRVRVLVPDDFDR